MPGHRKGASAVNATLGAVIGAVVEMSVVIRTPGSTNNKVIFVEHDSMSRAIQQYDKTN